MSALTLYALPLCPFVQRTKISLALKEIKYKVSVFSFSHSCFFEMIDLGGGCRSL